MITETKKGYKKTKLGWIPEEWEYVTLESICSKIGDGLHSTPKYDEDGEYYFINGNNLINNRIVFDEKTKKVGEEEFLKNQKKLNDSTILLSINGTIGNIAFYNNEPVILGKSAAYLNIKNKELKRYVAYQLSSFGVNHLFQKLVTGSTIKNLGLKAIQLTKIPLPPLPEQQKIAAILSTWDKAIDKLTQLIAAKEQHKKGLMQQLLTGKKRFAGFTDEWKEVKLGTLTSINMGQSPDSKSYNEGGVGLPLIQGNADLKNRKSSPRIWTSEPTKISEIGDLILTVRAPVGSVAKSFHNACIGRGVCSIKATKCDIEFIYQVLLFFEPRWQSLEQGSTFSAVSSKDIKGLKLKLPNSIQEQQKIASVLSAADKEIELLKSELERLQQQKKGLMQVLLTGKIRVKN
jgi:type I restriction enzyme S subunit